MVRNEKDVFINGVYHRIDSKSILCRRKFKKRLMKYVDALLALKAYGNGELSLIRVVDNNLNPRKSMSRNCQVRGCNQRIRYEYLLKNNTTHDEIIAGSTCVWELLGLSSSEIKDFNGIEKTIKDFHKMILWKRENNDVYKKVMQLKTHEVQDFKVFWEELEYTSLNDVDSDFIRGLNVDEEIKRNKKLKNERFLKEQEREEIKKKFKLCDYAKNNEIKSRCSDEKYIKIIGKLSYLSDDIAWVESYKVDCITRCLYEFECKKIVKQYNKEYFEKHIKGDNRLKYIYDNCDTVVRELFARALKDGELRVYKDDISIFEYSSDSIINKYNKQFNKYIDKNSKFKGYWNMYRLRYNIF